LLKGLQQLQQQGNQPAQDDTDDDDAVPQPAPPQRTTPKTLQTVPPQLRLQMQQNTAPTR